MYPYRLGHWGCPTIHKIIESCLFINKNTVNSGHLAPTAQRHSAKFYQNLECSTIIKMGQSWKKWISKVMGIISQNTRGGRDLQFQEIPEC